MSKFGFGPKLLECVCTFDLDIRINYFYYVRQFLLIVTVEIDGANSQLHYVKISVNMCLGNLVPITLRQKSRLTLFLNM